MPFHSGLIKYLKDKGLWTAEHDKWQSERLAEEKARMEEFKADPKAWQEKWGG